MSNDFNIEEFNRKHIENLRKLAKSPARKRNDVTQRNNSKSSMKRLGDVDCDALLGSVNTPAMPSTDAFKPAPTPTTQQNKHDESLEALAARKKREVMQHELAQATERAVAGKARKNASKRIADAQNRFYRKMVELSSFRDERDHYVKRDERKAFIDALRKQYAVDGRERANLATRHSQEKRQGAITMVLDHLMKKYKQRYCFPSQELIQWMLWRHYGILMSISTLNNDMQAMDDLRLITRKRRHALLGGKFCMASTLYLITKRGHSFRKSAKKLFSLLISTVFQNVGEYMVVDKSTKEKNRETSIKDSPSGNLQGVFNASYVEAWEFI